MAPPLKRRLRLRPRIGHPAKSDPAGRANIRRVPSNRRTRWLCGATSAQINVELVTTEEGVVGRQTRVEEGVPEIHYTARIRNNGAWPLSYNLNIGDWQ